MCRILNVISTFWFLFICTQVSLLKWSVPEGRLRVFLSQSWHVLCRKQVYDREDSGGGGTGGGGREEEKEKEQEEEEGKEEK